MQLDDLYRRVIMDHYKNPRNRGTFDNDAVTVNLNNPTCGDRISLQLLLKDGIVQEAKYTGEGCSISMSSASMMTDAVKGKSMEQALDLADRFSSLMKGEEVDFDDYEDLEALSGVNKFPARIKCATLAWNALRKGIDEEDNVQ
ncbi:MULTISPECIES: Fe-S cluster assembly sulfur transfer protein SufU [Paenibacillus]|uniref:Fe-S cluster assembly sulfur transfer protein SufU n=1 Tax=Paenibacillus illinoisensis TaxID=59845 RepID=A0A2W0C8V8_9BACL|nr:MULTISPECIES: SUF system NifU family Fe-S cluster assembly protein [Paenibacillus]MBM6382371.1 SUF system NifU family Fe-S cluster assembly protein [Paenibacillus sp.]MBE7679613.1 SUF system NifU family Fe-S cluster assembly protein [Paenibacillus sp. P13VS]MBY0218307.1 SUF system NifU family Fe-S cluster assembly protein [Paenibacillus illinoisensis]MCG7384872.1 SUF system NifU family Fe-S cluster assembly protein [Paenibacillus sp. ACRRY]MCM3205460.1 SUF system NifU family Fe-S cluster as